MIFNTKIRVAVMIIATAMVAAPVFAENAETSSFENIPNNLIYEGRLLSSTGQKLEGEYVARFSFWNNSDFTSNVLLESGLLNPDALGFSKWEEVIPLHFNDLGHFSVVLGESKDFSTLQFGSFKYLQVEIKKVSEADSEYQLIDINGDNGADTNDRKLIASVPYAIHSYNAQHAINAELAEGAKNPNFILDAENTAEYGNVNTISLQFGNDLDAALNKKLSYDLATQKFNFNSSVNITGDVTATGLINGVNLQELTTQVENIAVVRNSAEFIIDPNNQHETEDLVLQFGGALEKTLKWDIAKERFEFSDDLFIAGVLELVSDLKLGGSIELLDGEKVDGIDISALANIVSSNADKLSAAELVIAQNATAILANTDKITPLQAIVVENAGDILSNYNLITAEQAKVLANTNKITSLQAIIAENSEDILSNFTNIETLKVKMTNAEADIVVNAAEIVKNIDKITTAQTDIITNAGDILSNYSLITTEQAKTLANANKIEINTGNITGNTGNIVNNAIAIAAWENKMLVAETKIAENIRDIDKNVLDIQENIQTIGAHQEAIDSLKQAVATLQANQNTGGPNEATQDSDIIQAKADIDILESKVGNIEIDITGLKRDIVDLEADIAANAALILAHAQLINTLSTRLGLAENAIIVQARDILDNAEGISNAQRDIINNASAILVNNGFITQVQQGIINNASVIETIKTKVENLKNRVSDTENRLLTTENATGQNTIKIDALTADQTAQNNAININTGDVSDIKIAIGDGDFTGANYITFGEDLTDAIQDLDGVIKTVAELAAQNTNEISTLKDTILNMSFEQLVLQQLAIGTGVVALDGTDNKINVYASRETGIENAHHFYKIYSQQQSLQDIEIQFKVLLPKNFDTFEGLNFVYKTDGTNLNAKLDFELKDAAGNIAKSVTGLSENMWTNYRETNFSSLFAPQAGEYLYVTFKPYSQDKNEVKIGDISIEYKTK